MLNKRSLSLVLVLLAGLAGCAKKQAPVADQKKKSYRVVDMPVAHDGEEVADKAVKSFFDQDINEFVVMNQDEAADDSATKSKSSKNNNKSEFALADTLQDEETFNVIHFDFDKHDIRPDQRAKLAENTKKAKAVAKTAAVKPTFVIEGHCDEPGSPEYNLALSEVRAKNVAQELAACGVENIKTIGLGNTRPIVRNGNKEERNRRAEIHVVYS